MAQHTSVVHADLARKHTQMRADAFRFLRGTFYRWQQVWPIVCAESRGSPIVTAVGDLHVENFGTWRDVEGRLIWGVNDVDEACRLPYANDVTRLATSAFLAIDAAHLHLSHAEAAEAILNGYERGLRTGGRAFVLEGEHQALRRLAISELRDPRAFWDTLHAGRRVTGKLPRGARKALRALLPDEATNVTVRRRVAGVGSLGRPRFVAIAHYGGAPIAREIKARLPSACVWGGARDRSDDERIFEGAVRVADPFFEIRRRWVVRRLAPDCGRIELTHLPRGHDERRLLHAMGTETANIHLGCASASRVLRDMGRRSAHWLEADARRMADAILRDWEQWRARR
jgi:uncharacterized protein DUF2252